MKRLNIVCLSLLVLAALGVLPTRADWLAGRAVTGVAPNVPVVYFANNVRGILQVANFSAVRAGVTLPAGAKTGPVVIDTETGTSNPVTMTLEAVATPDLAKIAHTWTVSVTGAIAADAVWKRNTLITGTVTINPGVTLTITPGVTIFGAPGSELVVDGALVAVGTVVAPIYFTSSAVAPAPGDWLGIRVSKNSQGFSLKYALVQYATNGVFFRANAEGAANLKGELQYCTLQHNERGLYVYTRPDVSPYNLTASAQVSLIHSYIYSNTIAGVALFTDAGGGTTNNYSLVEHNRIEKNAIGVLISSNTWWLGHSNNTPVIRNNTVLNNREYGIDVRGYGSSDGSGSDTRIYPTLENNLLDGNPTGLRLYLNPQGSDGSQVVNPSVRYNTFANGKYAILLEHTQNHDTLTANVHDNVFYSFDGAEAYVVMNTTGRPLTVDSNYWGDGVDEWALGATGKISGTVTVNTFLTALDAPLLTHITPGGALPGQSITLHGANFGELVRVFLPLAMRH